MHKSQRILPLPGAFPGKSLLWINEVMVFFMVVFFWFYFLPSLSGGDRIS